MPMVQVSGSWTPLHGRPDEVEPRQAARRRGEGDLAAAATPSPGAYTADRPNDVWQIDHTLVDVIVVDEEHRRPIGRPALTLAIDVCTRMVAGFYLSLDPPSSASVGLCLLHAAYDKTAWLAERGFSLGDGKPEIKPQPRQPRPFRPGRCLSLAPAREGLPFRRQWCPPACPRHHQYARR